MNLLSFRALALGALATALSAPATAQYSASPATGLAEQYVVEFGTFWWNPPPEGVVQSSSLGPIGTPIDLVSDLGIEQERRPELRFVVKPFRKHKFRVNYLPIHYTAESILERSFVFNGTLYRVGLPVNSDFEWKAWRFGYEYDFISRAAGYVGFLADVKYTDVKLELGAPTFTETSTAKVPIPTIGGTFRVYPVTYASISGEISGITLPGSLADGDETAHYLDWEISGAVHFTRNVSFQVGYRVLDVGYRIDEDLGDFEFGGLYFGGAVRY